MTPKNCDTGKRIFIKWLNAGCLKQMPFSHTHTLTFSLSHPGISSPTLTLKSISPNLLGPPDNISSEACAEYL